MRSTERTLDLSVLEEGLLLVCLLNLELPV